MMKKQRNGSQRSSDCQRTHITHEDLSRFVIIREKAGQSPYHCQTEQSNLILTLHNCQEQVSQKGYDTAASYQAIQAISQVYGIGEANHPENNKQAIKPTDL